MKNILLTSAGRRVSLLRCLRRDLQSHVPEGRVFATDLQPERSAACQDADACFKVPRVTAPGYADELLTLCRNQGVRMVVPTIDTELILLAENRERFAEHGVEIVVSDLDLVQRCRDKRLTHELFADCGLPAPEVYPADSPSYPCFAKPRGGSCSVGLHLVPSAEEWPRDVRHDPDYLLCEYLDPVEHDEFTVDLYYRLDGELICIVPRQRLETRGGEVSKGLTVRHPLIKTVKQTLGSLQGARGCLTLQVFVNTASGKVSGIEINPRFGGGFPLTDRAGGRYTEWLIQEVFLGAVPPPTFDGWDNGLLMLRYDDEIFSHVDPTAS